MLGGSWSSGEVLASHSVTSSCVFLSAVTDGIPAASEGKIQAALKMEHTDGASLVSQGLGGEEEGTLQRYYPHRGVKGIDLGWAVQVNDDFTVALSRVYWEQGGNRGR